MKPRALALHQITMRDIAPESLAYLAARHGFAHISLFTHVPPITLTGGGKAAFPHVHAGNRTAVLQSLRDTGVAVTQCEYFPIRADTAIEAYCAGMALGAELGARRAVTHVHESDTAQAIDKLGQLADLAAEYGLALALEFMGLTPACNSLSRALWFCAQINRPNMGVGVDILHLVRSGGSVADLALAPSERLFYAQICDGKGLHASADYATEALDRLLPGTGDFPLVEFLRYLPTHIDLDVEVPLSLQRQATMTADARATQLYAATIALIQQASVG